MYSIPHKLSWYSCIQLVTAVPSYTFPLYCGLYGACRQLLVHICGTLVAHRLWPLTLIYAAVGLKDTHCLKCYNLQKFLSRKIMKKFIFLVQSIVYLAIFSNLWKNVAFFSCLAIYFFSSEIECSICTHGGRVIAADTQPLCYSASPLSCVLGRGDCSSEDYFFHYHQTKSDK